MKVVAIVPIKRHSERVKDKNIRRFNGKPLFWHILNTLSKCRNISDIWLDTDSVEIGEMVQKAFPNVIVIYRPEHLKGDMVTATELIANDLTQIDGEYFLYTHTTNPLLKAETIDNAIEFYNNHKYDSLFSVTKHHIRLFDKNMNPIGHNPNKLTRTQDLEPLYEDNSAMYIFSRESFKANNNRIGKNPCVYEIRKIEALDIDTEDDFTIAESVAYAYNPAE
jgi:CMP-N-acetylneuraminic acid synthetase